MINKIIEIKDHIKKVYKTYNRPFVIGFSGGKDSTATLQFVWEALSELPREDLINFVHVICSDTMVETPYIIDYISSQIKRFNIAAKDQNLPIHAQQLTPDSNNTYWVLLLGKGYPAPSQQFRWCTERLKVEPVNRYIAEKVAKWKEVTVVVGARHDESISRSKVLNSKARDPFGLSKHSMLPEAYVFTPIEHLTTEEVWDYLAASTPSWGGNHNELMETYLKAGGEYTNQQENPVIEKPTKPSRFGCWVCTLVPKDSTMENLINAGEEWMRPLFEFRNLLNETLDPAKKPLYRSHKRRNGKIAYITRKDPSSEITRIAYGPYKLEWRKRFLELLLLAQKSVRSEGPYPDIELITLSELEKIRAFWRDEEYDWADSVPEIYERIMGEKYPFGNDDGVSFTNEDLELLEKHCIIEGIPVGLVARLIDIERNMQGMARRSGITKKIKEIFDEDWASEEEALGQARS